MVINLTFKNSKILKNKESKKTETNGPNSFSLLVNIKYLTSIITAFEKKEEYLIGIINKNPIP